jgi:ribonuclease VapC
MVIDTSALLAILLAEPEAESMVRVITATDERIVGAPTLVEASAVMVTKKGPGGDVVLEALLRHLDVETATLSDSAAAMARLGYARFGKGVGSPGVLDYGDCLAYGLALALRQPLLFKGDDFLQTDVTPVEY